MPSHDDLQHDASHPTDAALWRRLNEVAPSTPCPAPLELASYADGLLAAVESDSIESHLATCVPCVEAVAEARVVQSRDSFPFAPAEVIKAACELVGTGRGRATRPAPWILVARWSVACAACLAMGVLGYEAGFSTSSPLNSARPDSGMAFGVFADPADDDVFSMFNLSGEVQ